MVNNIVTTNHLNKAMLDFSTFHFYRR